MDATPAIIFPNAADISKAAKKAFPAKPKVVKPAKPKAKKKAVKPAKKAKPAKKTVKKSKAKPASTVVRSERLDMRLSKGEKAKLVAKAKKLRRTVTSIVYEAIEKIK